MPIPIPNTIHFIWVGTPLRTREAQSLLKWADENPNYDVCLWAEPAQLAGHAEKLEAEYKANKPDAEVSTDSEDAAQTVVKLSEEVSVTILPITIIPAISDPGMMYEELKQWKNYGAASDILRVWVLHFKGGIYMDFDTYSTGAPLPLDILAPHDILFGKLKMMPIACNAVIAAPPNAYALEMLAKEMDTRYIMRPGVDNHEMTRRKLIEYVEVGRGLGVEVTAAAHERLAQLGECRERLQSSQVSPEAHVKATQDIASILMQPTCWRSGPFVAEDLVEDCAGPLMERQFRAARALFFFQDIAEYNLEISTDSTWVM